MIPKFRAWDKLNNEMYVVEQINFNRGEFESIGYGITFLREAGKVELMQSTGLKDKNGKEIFEGDILTNGIDVMSIKRHDTLGFYIDFKGEIDFIADGADLEEFEEDAKEIADIIEIIGNIYENPELLEVEE